MGGGDCGFGPDRKEAMESGRSGFFFGRGTSPAFPACSEVGREDRCMEEISGVGSWECGRMGKPRNRSGGVRLL